MKEPKKSIFNWNHISDELTEEQVEELKSYYHSYHKKCWAYKQPLKTFKKMEITRELIFDRICVWRFCFQHSNWWHWFDCYQYSSTFYPGLDEARRC